MQCKKCGFDNETTQAYCKLCGVRLTFTVGRAETSLREKATQENARETEEELRKLLVLSICVFLLLITLKAMFGRGSWTSVYFVPSSTTTAEFARLSYVYEVKNLPMDVIPITQK